MREIHKVESFEMDLYQSADIIETHSVLDLLLSEKDRNKTGR